MQTTNALEDLKVNLKLKLYIPYMLFNLAGETWIHMVFGAVVEVALLGLIIGYAWKWPRVSSEK